MHNIEAVGFDYGGVIGGGRRVGNKFTSEMCQLLKIDEETYRKTYFSMNDLINTGKVDTWLEFWKLFLAKLHLPSERIEPVMKLSQKYAKVYIETDEKIIDLIDTLRVNGYKVGLLSNATKENAAQMRAIGLNKHFDAFLISSEIGIQKPDPKAFSKLLSGLDVQPSSMVFVDDSLTSLEAAKTCGFLPILYQSYSQLINALKSLKVLTPSNQLSCNS